MASSRLIPLATVVLILGGVVASFFITGPKRPSWTEVQWPFPADQWGRGKAFECGPGDCGSTVRLFVRPKPGADRCSDGVNDDTALERIGDLDLLGGKASPMAPGRPIAVAGMNGRSRMYLLTGPKLPGISALSIAYSKGCDAVVATAIVQNDRPDQIEAGVLQLLGGPAVMRWLEQTRGP
jgi:hypothetical protein